MRTVLAVTFPLLLAVTAVAAEKGGIHAVPGDGTRYEIAPGSTVLAKVGSSGMLASLGHEHKILFSGVSGAIRLPAHGAAAVTIEVAAREARETLPIDADKRATIERRLQEEVLHSARYPTISFRGESEEAVVFQAARGEERVVVAGALTLHGTTRQVHVPLTVTRTGDRLQARGSFTIRRSDFGVEAKHAAGGLIKVNDKVELHLDVQAMRAR